MTVDVRAALQKTMTATVNDEKLLHNATYEAIRPMKVPTATRSYIRGMKWIADCSSGSRDVCWMTPGAPDPFNNGWAPWGNSSTIFFALHHVDDLVQAEPGDAFTFGYSSGEHHANLCADSAMKVADIPCWNFGEQGQPIISTLGAEMAYHKGMTVTLCKLPVIDPPVTPEDSLRAMVGFYSWAAWKLGEGPWKHYGAGNKTVRPHVPADIPDEWWTHYKSFLANRKKGNPK